MIGNISKFNIFEITRELSLKETLQFKGVCKELHRKINYKNAAGEYICLIKDRPTEFEDVTKKFLNSSSIQKMRIFLKAGADINAKIYADQDTTLMWAAYDGKTEIVEFLLENGANPNIQNSYEETALMMASEENFIKIVNLLLKSGADVNCQNGNGNTALTIAAKEGNIEIVKILLVNGSDINHQNENGYTALILAAKNHMNDVVKFLLENGANASLENESGDTALMSAAKFINYAEVVKLLCDEQNQRMKKMIRVQHYRNMVEMSRSGFYCIKDGRYHRIKLCPVCDELQRAGAYYDCDTCADQYDEFKGPCEKHTKN